jgi:SNF family Na+-dependent transporter
MSKYGSTNEAYEMDITSKTPPLVASNKMDDSENDKDDSNNLESGTSETKTEVQRDGWSNQIEFIMCTMGYAVGLGNVWRFPYLVYKNGGGTFLIPYFTSLLFIGLPVFFLELALGQFSGQGPVRLFGRISPIFKGLGWAMLSATIFVSLYYNVIMAWTLFYMIKGFSSELPWSSCTSDSSNHCVENFTNIDTNDSFAVGPSEDFFLHQMLGIDKAVHNWDNFGTLQWKMILCLFAAWTIICLCLIKGVQSAGKVTSKVVHPYLV